MSTPRSNTRLMRQRSGSSVTRAGSSPVAGGRSTKDKTVPPPSAEKLSWIRGLTISDQRSYVAEGHRVKVRFDDGLWYGGLITGVAKVGARIRIKYDDGTSEVSKFPERGIVVDDEHNRKHMGPADKFMPPKLSRKGRLTEVQPKSTEGQSPKIKEKAPMKPPRDSASEDQENKIDYSSPYYPKRRKRKTPDFFHTDFDDGLDGDGDESKKDSSKKNSLKINDKMIKELRRNIASGQRVKVRLNTKGAGKYSWYVGKVNNVTNGGSKIRIRYDDGETEDWPYPDKNIELIEDDSSDDDAETQEDDIKQPNELTAKRQKTEDIQEEEKKEEVLAVEKQKSDSEEKEEPKEEQEDAVSDEDAASDEEPPSIDEEEINKRKIKSGQIVKVYFTSKKDKTGNKNTKWYFGKVNKVYHQVRKSGGGARIRIKYDDGTSEYTNYDKYVVKVGVDISPQGAKDKQPKNEEEEESPEEYEADEKGETDEEEEEEEDVGADETTDIRTKNLQLQKIKSGHRVEVRTTSKKSTKGKVGTVNKVYYHVRKSGGSRIRIRYDDGTSEYRNYPDDSIILLNTKNDGAKSPIKTENSTGESNHTEAEKHSIVNNAETAERRETRASQVKSEDGVEESEDKPAIDISKLTDEDYDQVVKEAGNTMDSFKGNNQLMEWQKTWNNMLKRIVKYQKKYGHCNVPKNYEINRKPLLGKWVAKQRYLKKKSQLLPERMELLEKIGFEWTGRQPTHVEEEDKQTEDEFQEKDREDSPENREEKTVSHRSRKQLELKRLAEEAELAQARKSNDSSDGARRRSARKRKKYGSDDASDEEDSEEDDRQWVQCDSCKKWRVLPDNVDIDTLPKIWYCRMNVYDPEHSRCNAREQTLKDVNKRNNRQQNMTVKKQKQVENKSVPTTSKNHTLASRKQQLLDKKSRRLVTPSSASKNAFVPNVISLRGQSVSASSSEESSSDEDLSDYSTDYSDDEDMKNDFTPEEDEIILSLLLGIGEELPISGPKHAEKMRILATYSPEELHQRAMELSQSRKEPPKGSVADRVQTTLTKKQAAGQREKMKANYVLKKILW